MSGLIVADDWIARLAPDIRDALTAQMTERPFAAGDIVVHAGERADAIFRVREGFLKQTGLGEDGERILLTVYGPGACFAETAVVAGLSFNHTTVALTDAVVERLPAPSFWALYDAHAAISDALCRKFAHAIRRQVADREERSTLTARPRIARLFADLATVGGTLEPDGRRRIDLPLSHSDVAAHLGLTRQSVQRELATFKTGGVIVRLSHGWLVDHAALIRTA